MQTAVLFTLLWLAGGGRATWIQPGGPPALNFFDRLVGNYKPRLRATPMKLEPKTFFANERTFLSWLHMAVTIGSIAAALLGFAATADRYFSHTAAERRLFCHVT